jgi:hypothetical protein
MRRKKAVAREWIRGRDRRRGVKGVCGPEVRVASDGRAWSEDGDDEGPSFSYRERRVSKTWSLFKQGRGKT